MERGLAVEGLFVLLGPPGTVEAGGRAYRLLPPEGGFEPAPEPGELFVFDHGRRMGPLARAAWAAAAALVLGAAARLVRGRLARGRERRRREAERASLRRRLREASTRRDFEELYFRRDALLAMAAGGADPEASEREAAGLRGLFGEIEARLYARDWDRGLLDRLSSMRAGLGGPGGLGEGG